jgi:predicted dithiol-disulfide oxidoreductase (DUF899 family)
MKVEFPGETAAYRAARNELLTAEVEMRRATEAVAERRRQLPPGGEIPEDYAFQEQLADGSVLEVRLSELFGSHRTVAIYNMMFPRSRNDTRPGPASGATASLPLDEGPCPSCTALIDQLDGASPHLDPRMTFVIVAKTAPERLHAFGQERGWRHLRLLSSAGNSYNRDYLGETRTGAQQPMLNVFEREQRVIRHFWGTELLYAPMDPGQEMRHVGTLEPLWNMLDMTREGRGSDWEEQLQYSCCRPSGETG